jgi:hypothetical protein
LATSTTFLFEIGWKTAVLALPVVVMVMFGLWSQTKKRIGLVRCRRCGHEGQVAGRWVPFRGVVAVCEVCRGDFWTRVS